MNPVPLSPIPPLHPSASCNDFTDKTPPQKSKKPDSQPASSHEYDVKLAASHAKRCARRGWVQKTKSKMWKLRVRALGDRLRSSLQKRRGGQARRRVGMRVVVGVRGRVVPLLSRGV